MSFHCSNGFCSDAIIRSNQTPNPSRRRSYRSRCSDVRAVKETDLKSVGQCPRRFKSCSERCYSFFLLAWKERRRVCVYSMYCVVLRENHDDNAAPPRRATLVPSTFFFFFGPLYKKGRKTSSMQRPAAVRAIVHAAFHF